MILICRTRGIFQLITRPSHPFGHGPQMEVALPDLKDPSDTKILKKRSHPKAVNGTESGDEDLSVEDPEETARITYKNKTLHMEFHNEFSSNKYPNDYILQLCHLAQHST